MIYFTDNFKAIAEEWKKKPEKFARALGLGLKEGLLRYESHLQKNQLSGRKSENYGLKVQSGIARESLNVVMSIEGEDVLGKITVGKNAWYLKVHEHYKFNGYRQGGTYFTIPINNNAIGKKARDFNLTFVKRPGRNPLLIQKENKNVMFTLVKYIPKRTYFYEEFPTIGDRFIRERIAKNLERVANEK
jgi:hypothetical protein